MAVDGRRGIIQCDSVLEDVKKTEVGGMLLVEEVPVAPLPTAYVLSVVL